ncbi:MAG: membrane protein insertion efficiency factor YidD [Dethiobacter sp.]|nr:membrane protein insertion efficiency factor YidD [Dethiobacter sp.]MCL5981481.1 membrane protein insertion efficiency factor YidD [Bacillota bacterium]
MQKALLLFIKAYRMFFSPLRPACCRFQPTCSLYALQAVERYGAWRGSYLFVRRLLRCHPFHPGGWDPLV